ncbi:hypothetical protein ENSA5_56890 [Enhygromyxa salina]|uniref:Type 1 periplasmic binding fold superfamily protein n=1 Tax=Enhygromyxa salina TaxID=215803 RepID=A0A2S9XEI3_9BACT|nr:hypothetical protein [Enhygromyxa salina]PRP91276.1 hypothetical protein ENSA5_56890 [Enhygromyxa salina]
MHFKKALGVFFLTVCAATGCVTGDDDHDDHDHDDDGDHDHETEVISRVELTFTPTGGGDAVTAAFSDPDGDGGTSGTSEPIELTAGTEYELTITLTNDLEDPPVDITEEIREEAEEHQIFIADDALLLTTAYADLESDYGSNTVDEDLPVGLVQTVTAETAGTGNFRVILRHLPELNDSPQKTAGLEEDFAAGTALPGDVDVDVSFELTVI